MELLGYRYVCHWAHRTQVHCSCHGSMHSDITTLYVYIYIYISHAPTWTVAGTTAPHLMSAVLFKKTSTRQSKYLCVPGSKTAQTTYRPRSCFASSLPVSSHYVTACPCPRCSCALLSRVWIVRQRLNRLSPFSHCTLHAVQRQTLISISLFSLYLSLSTFHMCEPIRWILAATGTQFENTFCTTPEQVWPSFCCLTFESAHA